MLPFLEVIESESQRQAISYIFEHYYSKMVYVANCILHNTADAEDAAMDAFKNMSKTPEKFENYLSKETISLALLYTKNAAKDIYRKNQKRRSTFVTLDCEDRDAKFECISDPDQDLDAIIVNQENKDILTDAIAQLDDGYRDLILMRYYHGMKNTEIAVLLSISADTVANRIHRARMRLYDIIKERGVRP